MNESWGMSEIISIEQYLRENGLRKDEFQEEKGRAAISSQGRFQKMLDK